MLSPEDQAKTTVLVQVAMMELLLFHIIAVPVRLPTHHCLVSSFKDDNHVHLRIASL